VNLAVRHHQVAMELRQRLTDAVERLGAEAAEELRPRLPRRTGALQQSVYFTVEREHTAVTLRIGASAPHALSVELGTAHTSPQPVFYPHAQELRQELPRRLAEHYGGEL
jgi:hypothetical protein